MIFICSNHDKCSEIVMEIEMVVIFSFTIVYENGLKAKGTKKSVCKPTCCYFYLHGLYMKQYNIILLKQCSSFDFY